MRADAQFVLGCHYDKGKPQRGKSGMGAAVWYGKAAHQEHARAQRNADFDRTYAKTPKLAIKQRAAFATGFESPPGAFRQKGAFRRLVLGPTAPV